MFFTERSPRTTRCRCNVATADTSSARRGTRVGQVDVGDTSPGQQLRIRRSETASSLSTVAAAAWTARRPVKHESVGDPRGSSTPAARPSRSRTASGQQANSSTARRSSSGGRTAPGHQSGQRRRVKSIDGRYHFATTGPSSVGPCHRPRPRPVLGRLGPAQRPGAARKRP